MSAGKESPGDRRDSIFLTSSESDSPPSLSPNLLEKVLEKTLDVCESAEPLDGATRTALLDYARQNGAAADLSEALLVDLVHIVLKHEMALLAGQPGGNMISDQVAHSIWDDPAARQRASNMWRLLQGRTR